MYKINFFNDDRIPVLKDKRRLKTFIGNMFLKEKKTLLNLAYIFCSDDKLFNINVEFLRHHYYTDVISFNLSSTQYIEAEIYISVDRVKENAKIIGVPFREELHRVILHGALHICGYKDKTKKDSRIMKGKENRYLKNYLQSNTN